MDAKGDSHRKFRNKKLNHLLSKLRYMNTRDMNTTIRANSSEQFFDEIAINRRHAIMNTKTLILIGSFCFLY
jgi:hypothetical protein